MRPQRKQRLGMRRRIYWFLNYCKRDLNSCASKIWNVAALAIIRSMPGDKINSMHQLLYSNIHRPQSISSN